MCIARFENINTHRIFVPGDTIEIGPKDVNKQIAEGKQMHEKRFNLIHNNKNAN